MRDTHRLNTIARQWAGQDETGAYVKERLEPALALMEADPSLLLQIPTAKRVPMGIGKEEIIRASAGSSAKAGHSKLIPKLKTVIVNADELTARVKSAGE